MRLVRTLRSLLGIGQQELASKAAISSRELSRLESGAVTAKAETAEALDRAFDAIIDRRLRQCAGPKESDKE